MPHVHIEFPGDRIGARQIEALLERVHRAVTASDLFDPGHVRVRAVPMEHYLIGGVREPFVHIRCHIHSGRNAEQKGILSRGILAAVQGAELPLSSITVEVVEMNLSGYSKYSAQVV